MIHDIPRGGADVEYNGIPLPLAEVAAAIDDYTAPSTPEQQFTSRVIEDFFGDTLNARMLDVISLAKSFDNPATRESSFGLYMHEHAPELHMPVASMLMERLRIDEFVSDELTRNHVKSDTNETVVPLPHEHQRWEDNKHALWDGQAYMSSQLDDLLKKVTLESVVFKAAEIYTKLRNPSLYESDYEQFKDVYTIEAIYAPICEINGFDGFASALRSEANLTRLRATGDDQYIAMAEAMLNDIHLDETSPVLFMEELLTKLTGDSSHRTILRTDTAHGITVGEGVCGMDTQNRVNWRIKSLGSLAMKLKRAGATPDSKLPMDIFGATIITKDTTALAQVYSDLIAGCSNAKSIEPNRSPRHTKPFVIIGSKTFVDTIRKKLGLSIEEFREAYEYDIKPGNYQRAKITLNHTDSRGNTYPVEIQVVTEASRMAYRTDPEQAHGIYKSAGVLGAYTLDSIMGMHGDRTHFADQYGIPKASHAPGAVLVKRSQQWLLKAQHTIKQYMQ